MTHRMIGLTVLFSAGCLERELAPVGPQVQSGSVIEWEQGGANDVDLLVLVDNSGSMKEEQDNLAANMPGLIATLTNPGDQDGDGEADPGVDTLHIGVISTDMGTGGEGTLCSNAEAGDDGVLQHLPSTEVEGCDATYPSFLTYDAAGDESIGLDFECIAKLGTGGCGFEQQLAAVEKALTVHAAPGAANDGFLRRDALLAVLLVTDEEDCSAADPHLFDNQDSSLGSVMDLRCYEHPEMLRSVDEFVTSILSVKPDHPEDIVVAAITGVPADLVALGEGQYGQDADEFEDVLNDSRMQEIVDVSGGRLVPSCDVAGLGLAYPPRRIVQFVEQMDLEGASGIVQSICQADWGPTMAAIQRLITRQLDEVCLARPLEGPGGVPVRAGEHAECVVRETLTDSRDCGPGRIEVGEDDGRTVCQVCQAGDGEDGHLIDAEGRSLEACAGSADYWIYSTGDSNCDSGRIEFTAGATPENGSEVLLQCLTSIGS
jgi:hypothetical protein